MADHQLNLEEREVIAQIHYSGTGPAMIARHLNRSPSAVSRELTRNSDSEVYRAWPLRSVRPDVVVIVRLSGRWTILSSTNRFEPGWLRSGLQSRSLAV